MALIVQAFQSMAKRESIQRTVERKTSDFYISFMADLNIVKKQLDLVRRSPPKDPMLPRYAGQAIAALTLSKRIERTWEAVQVSCLQLSTSAAQRTRSPEHPV